MIKSEDFYDFYESEFQKFRLKIALSPKLDFKIILEDF